MKEVFKHTKYAVQNGMTGFDVIDYVMYKCPKASRFQVETAYKSTIENLIYIKGQNKIRSKNFLAQC